jgi:hypothetical protein
MKYGIILLWLLLWAAAPANAQHVSIGIGFPHVSIGINLPLVPDLEPVPGYPVYYAPEVDSNYFFYDGMYWVLQDDNWYASSWYNGPWGVVGPEYVPAYLLRIPVRYYRRPPEYFRGWRSEAPPRWGEHWGHDWEQHRRGWDHGNRRSAPRPAPLPVYQREYGGERYPRVEQQPPLHNQNYQYRPRDPVVREHYEVQRGQPYEGPRGQRRNWQPVPRQQQPEAQRQQQPAPRSHDQGRGHDKGDDRGQDRGRGNH